jgi:acetate kinase
MKVMVFNSGSSSIKYRLFDMSDRSVLASGMLERIGEEGACLDHEYLLPDGNRNRITRTHPVLHHREAMRQINAALRETDSYRDASELLGIGHRMAHGGEAFRQPTLIDGRVLETIRHLTPLAPLHNPAMATGIDEALAAFPGVPQVAVFDTAFHHTLAAARLPLRRAAGVLRPLPRPPLWFPRHIDPVRRQTVRTADGPRFGVLESDCAAFGQRQQRRRGSRGGER